jgi:hypothetical protein
MCVAFIAGLAQITIALWWVNHQWHVIYLIVTELLLAVVVMCSPRGRSMP